jgi:glycosyltransferase involved in cell wall biosynthesis
VPLVWTLHGITEKETLQRFRDNRTAGTLARHVLYRALERLSLRIAPDIVVDTPYVRAAVATPNSVHVLPQGVFAEELRAADLQARDPHLLLSIGVMSPRKGHLLTLDAFAKVRETVPAVRLVIAGSRAYPEYHQAIEQRILDLGLSACVTVRTDIGRADIVALLGRARVFVLHSQEESQGIALCEALSAGVPVVATRVGGIPDVVAEGQDGFLVAYGDLAGFADAVTALLADDGLHARLSRHGRMASARFDWANIAAAMCDIYRGAQLGRLPKPIVHRAWAPWRN